MINSNCNLLKTDSRIPYWKVCLFNTPKIFGVELAMYANFWRISKDFCLTGVGWRGVNLKHCKIIWFNVLLKRIPKERLIKFLTSGCLRWIFQHGAPWESFESLYVTLQVVLNKIYMLYDADLKDCGRTMTRALETLECSWKVFGRHCSRCFRLYMHQGYFKLLSLKFTLPKNTYIKMLLADFRYMY